MGMVNSNFLPASLGLNLGNQNQRWNTFFENVDATSISAGTITGSNIGGVRYADKFGSIQAALNDLAGPGTVYVPFGYTETITASIALVQQRLVVDPGATLSFDVGGQILVSTDGVLDAAGCSFTTTWTAGNLLQINSGRATAIVSQLIGPGSGTGNGLCFDGCSTAKVSVGLISGHGLNGVLFNCVGVSSICDNNEAHIGQISGNGTGVLFTNKHSSGDGEVQNNIVYAGLIGGNTNAELQYGDSGTFNAPQGSAQGNKVFSFCDASASAHAAVTFLNCSYNFWQGQYAGTGFSFTNSFHNQIDCPVATLTDMNNGQGQQWNTGSGLQTPGGVSVANAQSYFSRNSAGLNTALITLDGTDKTIITGDLTVKQIYLQPQQGQNTMYLDGATNGVFIPGIVKVYNNENLENAGIPSEVAAVNLINQSAAITTTVLYAVPTAGEYRLMWNAKITTVASTGAGTSTLGALTIAYSDPDGVVVTLTAAAIIAAGTVATTSTANTTGTALIGIPQLLNCKAATNISYAFAYVSDTAAQMAFNLNISLEAL